MSASTVGALRVDLGLNSAQFAQGLSGAQGALNKFATGMGAALGNIAASMALAATALTAGIISAADNADKMGKAAEKMGMPVEELSRLTYAAQLSGASFESLQSSFTSLAKAMAESADGLGTKGALAIDKLGISLKDAEGNMRPTSEVFEEAIALLGNYENNANRAAVGTALFGSSYRQLVPLIDGGTEAMAKAKAEADALGVTLSSSTAKGASEFKDNMFRIGQAVQGSLNAALSSALPYLQMFTDYLVESAKESRTFESVGEGVAWIIDKIARIAAFGTGVLQTLAAGIYGVGSALASLATLDGAGALQAMEQMATRAAEIAASVQSTLNGLNEIQNQARPLTIPGGAGGNRNRPDIGGLGRGDGGIERMSAEQRKFERELERFKQSIRTPYEELQEQLLKIDQYFQEGRISAEQFGIGVENAYKKFREESLRSSDLAQTLQSSLGGIFDSILNGTFKARDALRKLAADLAKMMANRLIKDLLGNIFSSAAGGGEGGGFFSWLGSLFGGGKAVGGPVSSRRAYLVGEQGPELMVPNTAGTIIPARDLAGAGAGGPIPIEIMVSPTGEFDARVGRIADSRAVVAVRTGLAEYDRNVAPTTMRRIESDPRRIG